MLGKDERKEVVESGENKTRKAALCQRGKTNKRKPTAAKQRITSMTLWRGKMDTEEKHFPSQSESVIFLAHA